MKFRFLKSFIIKKFLRIVHHAKNIAIEIKVIKVPKMKEITYRFNILLLYHGCRGVIAAYQIILPRCELSELKR